MKIITAVQDYQRIYANIEGSRQQGESMFTIMHSTYKWRKVRNEHVAVEDCCQMCRIMRELQVHHVKSWAKHPELRYDRKNLITLCQPCHFRFGHFLNWRDSNPDIRILCWEAKENYKKVKVSDENEV